MQYILGYINFLFQDKRWERNLSCPVNKSNQMMLQQWRLVFCCCCCCTCWLVIFFIEFKSIFFNLNLNNFLLLLLLLSIKTSPAIKVTFKRYFFVLFLLFDTNNTFDWKREREREKKTGKFQEKWKETIWQFHFGTGAVFFTKKKNFHSI